MRRLRTSPVRNGSLVALFVLVLGGCGGASTPASPEACPEPTPVTDLSLMPRDLPLQKYTTITQISVKRGFLAVVSTSDRQVVELFPELSRALVAGGYDIRSSDNEGFEAEIYFSRRSTLGSFRMREGPCEGEVTVRLSYLDEKYEKAS
jgi:hypothetical protein